MNLQEMLEKWMMTDRDSTPLWRLPINEIEYEPADDPTDGVEIAALAENIRQCGLLHPILVEKQKRGHKYSVICGRRRLEAVALLGRTHISAILVKSENISRLKVSLSENLMRKVPHFLDLAVDLDALLKEMSLTDAARLFSVKEESLRSKLALTTFSPYEKRLIRLLKLSEEDALMLCKIENSMIRKLLLEKIMESGDACDRSALIRQAVERPDLRLTQSEKIFVRDIRVFLNTVERAAEMMRSAGFATEIERHDEGDSYRFAIKVSKTKSSSLKKASKDERISCKSATADVSRETFGSFDNGLSENAADVSRETSENRLPSIDEWGDSWYNRNAME